MASLTPTTSTPIQHTEPSSPPLSPSSLSHASSFARNQKRAARRARRSSVTSLDSNSTQPPLIPQRTSSISSPAPLFNRFGQQIDPSQSLGAPGPSTFSAGLQPSALPKKSPSSQRSFNTITAKANSLMNYSNQSGSIEMYDSSASDEEFRHTELRPRPSTSSRNSKRKQKQQAPVYVTPEKPRRRGARSVQQAPALPGITSDSAGENVPRRREPKRRIEPPPKQEQHTEPSSTEAWVRSTHQSRQIEVVMQDRASSATPSTAATYTPDLGSGISSESSRESSPPLAGSVSSPATSQSPARWPSMRDSNSASPGPHTHFYPSAAVLAAHDHQPKQADFDPVELHPDHIVFPPIPAARAPRSRETSRDTQSVASSIRSMDSWARTPYSPNQTVNSPATTIERNMYGGSANQSPASFRFSSPKIGPSESTKKYFPSPPPKSAARQPAHLHEASPPGLFTSFNSLEQQAASGPVESTVIVQSSPVSTRKNYFPTASHQPESPVQRRSAPSVPSVPASLTSEGTARESLSHRVPVPRVSPAPVFPSRALHNNRSPSLGNSVFPTRQSPDASFASQTMVPSASVDSIAVPLHPVDEDGRMKALLQSRRVSRAPWEDGGDELDWMVAAQRKLDPKLAQWDDETDPEGSPPANTTIRRTLGSPLLSDQLSMMDLNPSPSVIFPSAPKRVPAPAAAAAVAAPAALAAIPASPNPNGARRASTCSDGSGFSEYVDASPHVDESDKENAMTQSPQLEFSKQQTSMWVLDTLAQGSSAMGRSLSAIGEQSELDEGKTPLAGSRPSSPRRASKNALSLSIVTPPLSPAVEEEPKSMRSPLATAHKQTSSGSSVGLLSLPASSTALRSPTTPTTPFDYTAFPPVPLYAHSNTSSISTSEQAAGYVSTKNSSSAAKKVFKGIFSARAGGRSAGGGGARSNAGISYLQSARGVSSESFHSSGAESFSTGAGDAVSPRQARSRQTSAEQQLAGAAWAQDGSPAGEETDDQEVLKSADVVQLESMLERFQREERERFKSIGAGRAQTPSRLVVA